MLRICIHLIYYFFDSEIGFYLQQNILFIISKFNNFDDFCNLLFSLVCNASYFDGIGVQSLYKLHNAAHKGAALQTNN